MTENSDEQRRLGCPTPVEIQIESLKTLAPGWYDAETPAYDPAALDWFAEVLVRVLDRFQLPRPYIYPTPEGTARAEWSSMIWEVCANFDLRTKRVDVLAAHIGSDATNELAVRLTDGDAENELGCFLRDHLWSLDGREPTSMPVRGARFLKQVQEVGDLDVTVLASSRFPSTEWALETSKKVLEILRRAECPLEPQLAISREGRVVLTLEKDRRVVSYECDLDGQVVLTLVDYDSEGSEGDVETEVLELSAIHASLSRALEFLS